MMARPRRSTIDELIDTFADWDVDTQERVIDQLELVQRLAKRRESKRKTETEAGQAMLADMHAGATD
jgi:hypothetical protein